MDKPFKFRYASRLAGAFVLLGVLLFVAGVFLAGRAKGWFEGKFEVHTLFDTAEGSFGLREGSEVQIRNTVAGRVGKIRPNAAGEMEATFILLERFHPFVTRDSVVIVKKKFQVAGDAFVQISQGTDLPVEDGAMLPTRKDEEIMEKAQALLDDFQKVALPLLDEVKQLLEHANEIAAAINNGDGVVGAAIHDPVLADGTRDAIERVNLLLAESRETLQESTRLIRGVQKHWLVRKYVEQDPSPGLSLAVPSAEDADEQARWVEALVRAREADDSEAVLAAAYGLGVSLVTQGDLAAVDALVREARVEGAAQGRDDPRMLLLEAEVYRRRDRPQEALALLLPVLEALGKRERDLRLHANLMAADLYRQQGRLAEARRHVEAVATLLRKTEAFELTAMGARVRGELLLAEAQPGGAATAFDEEAAALRKAGRYTAMAMALESAANAYRDAGNQAAAADRYFRAGRSLHAGGDRDDAKRLLELARPAAHAAGDETILAQIEAILSVAE